MIHAALRGKRAVVLLYSYFPADPRPRRAAEAMVKAGLDVDLVCLRNNGSEPRKEVVGKVRVTRIPLKKRRSGKLIYIWQYIWFILSAFTIVSLKSLRNRYDVVHVHNMPDVLVFSAIVPRLLGARLILDLHDPMPELFSMIFALREENWIVRSLKRLERWSIAFSHLVLTPNRAFRELFASRSCSLGKIQVVMNSPDEEIFDTRRPKDSREIGTRRTDEFVVMYHGSIVERHGLDLLIAAVERIRPVIPGIRLQIYGHETQFLEKVMDQVSCRGLADCVSYRGGKDLAGIAEAIRACDVGVIPNKSGTFTRLNLPTRIFEYLAMGKAVIAPRTKGITDYFTEEELFFFELGDSKDLSRALADVYRDPERAFAVMQRGQEIYRLHTWSKERGKFLDVTERTLAGV